MHGSLFLRFFLLAMSTSHYSYFNVQTIHVSSIAIIRGIGNFIEYLNKTRVPMTTYPYAERRSIYSISYCIDGY